jgi:alkanesulfonate monooxygenase SsuD/methylene tetrahydromethanopterin reductase-like flavin-dependent oxidoreductase (luciferase family)
MTAAGVVFTPKSPPERLREVALAAEAAGFAQLRLWEDWIATLSGIGADTVVFHGAEPSFDPEPLIAAWEKRRM